MIKYLAFSMLVSGFLVGCSSQPRQVEASLPLVKQQIIPIGKKLPAKYRQQLEDHSTKWLIHKDYDIEMGAFYTSSLGNDCRKLNVRTIEKVTVQRIACAEKSQYEGQVRAWYLVPDIVQSATSIQL